MTDGKQTQRIDKWLWHARFVKTRSLAQKLITSGRVRLDRSRISSTSHPVRPGNVLTLSLPKQVCIVEIIDIAERRGPYCVARLLYNDLTPEISKPSAARSQQPTTAIIEKEKRPDSRSRRLAIKLKQGSTDE